MTDEIKNILDFHADDYGISKNSCDDILKLLSHGCLDSISVLPNMNTFEYAAGKLRQFNDDNLDKIPHVTVHLNFLEGHCCAPAEDVSDLVDENGYFKINWGNLFKWNYSPLKRSKIKRQLVAEIKAQTKKCIDAGIVMPDNLRFDGHQHTHMIPLVFHALLEVCDDFEMNGCKTTFIRNTEDALYPYYKSARKACGLRKTFNKVNIVKCLILNHYSHFVRKELQKRNLPVPYLCGVFFSGHMDSERLLKVLPSYCRKPLAEKREVELLFHPGTVLDSEITDEFVKPDFNLFHTSSERKTEYDSVIRLTKAFNSSANNQL